MTPDLLIRTGKALYADQWRAPLADALDVGDRSIRRLVSDRTGPESVLGNLLEIVEAKREALGDVHELLTEAQVKRA